jgi:hypothetical protein
MSFIPENTPFIALPTALKGKVTPYQLSVLWVLQSYYPNIWPSYTKIAEDAKMSRSKVITTVDELVELNLLQKQFRIDESGQRTNCYRVTIWSQCKTLPVPDTSFHAGSLTHTGGSPSHTLGGSLRTTGVVHENDPNYNNLTKTKLTIKPISSFFEPFWEAYRKIPTSMRVVSQSKKLAKAEFSKLSKKTQEKILDCLQADIRARSKQLKNDNFTPLFPDCFRYLKNGQYEQYLLTVSKNATTLGKPKQNTPF